jgi:hypothetical protein
MGTSTSNANSWLLLMFNTTTFANYAINATASPETAIATSLNVADPGAGGTMATSEIAYTTYARVSVTRASGAGGFTVTSNAVSNQAAITFGACTVAGTSPATFMTWGKTGGGSALILWSGSVSPSIAVSAGVTPSLTTATALTIT